MNIMLIAVTGNARHGKNSIGDYLVAKHNFIDLAFALTVKKICKIKYLLTDDQLFTDKKDVIDERWGKTPRDMFKFEGTEIGQYQQQKFMEGIGRNFWIKRLGMELDEKINTVLTDCRYPHEAEMIKKKNGFIIRIIRPSMEITDSHSSETEMNLIKDEFIDAVVINDGTIEELHEKIEKIYQQFLKRI